MNNLKKFGIICTALASFAVAAPAAVANDNSGQMQILDATSIPIGHAHYCQRLPHECVGNRHIVEEVSLNEQNWRELLTINAQVNAAIKPITDMEFYQTAEHWTMPRTHGDCEDYVLMKRAALIERGWPASTLLITVVREPSGEGHAVLTVKTDRGDVILDNQDGLVHLWHNTPYEYVKRQSQHHQAVWVNVNDNRPSYARLAHLNR